MLLSPRPWCRPWCTSERRDRPRRWGSLRWGGERSQPERKYKWGLTSLVSKNRTTEQDPVSTMQKTGLTNSSLMVWSGLKKCITCVITMGQSTAILAIFSMVMNNWPNKQPGGPSASLHLTSEKAVFCSFMSSWWMEVQENAFLRMEMIALHVLLALILMIIFEQILCFMRAQFQECAF